MIRSICLFIALCPTVYSHGQLTETFGDGEFLNDPPWTGDADQFTVDQQTLRSNSENDSSVFSLLLPHSGTYEEWEAEVQLDLKTSSRNYVILSILHEQMNNHLSDGIHIQLGGTKDRIAVSLLDGGIQSELLNGPEGMTENCTLVLRTLRSNGSMTLQYHYRDSMVWRTIGAFECKKTVFKGFLFSVKQSTPTFFYRHRLHRVYIGPRRADRSPPKLLTGPDVSGDTLLLRFNEPLADIEESRVLVDGREIVGSQPIPGLLRVVLPQEANGGLRVQLEGVLDTSGNRLDTSFTYNFTRLFAPSKGSIRFNEILYEPLPGLPEFLELVNLNSTHADLSLITLIRRSANGSVDSVNLPRGTSAGPQQFILLCSDPTTLCSRYPCDSALLLELSIPSLLNEGATLLLDHGRIRLDSVRYSSAMHHPLHREVKGMSLEKRAPGLESAEERNWSSASPLFEFATPGRRNSIEQLPVSIPSVHLESPHLSPDGDGLNDELCLVLDALPEGYALSAWIFDVQGRLVRQLESALIPGNAQVIRWDLMDPRLGVLAGAYILVLTGHDPEGNTFKKKLPFSVASQY